MFKTLSLAANTPGNLSTALVFLLIFRIFYWVLTWVVIVGHIGPTLFPAGTASSLFLHTAGACHSNGHPLQHVTTQVTYPIATNTNRDNCHNTSDISSSNKHKL